MEILFEQISQLFERFGTDIDVCVGPTRIGLVSSLQGLSGKLCVSPTNRTDLMRTLLGRGHTDTLNCFNQFPVNDWATLPLIILEAANLMEEFSTLRLNIHV